MILVNLCLLLIVLEPAKVIMVNLILLFISTGATQVDTGELRFF